MLRSRHGLEKRTSEDLKSGARRAQGESDCRRSRARTAAAAAEAAAAPQPAAATGASGLPFVRVSPLRVRAPRRRVEGWRRDAADCAWAGGVEGCKPEEGTRGAFRRARAWCCPSARWCCRPHCADENEGSRRRAGGRRAEGAAQSTSLARACARRPSLGRSTAVRSPLAGASGPLLREAAESLAGGGREHAARRRGASASRPSGPRPRFARGAAGGPQHNRRGTLAAAHCAAMSRVCTDGALAASSAPATLASWRAATCILDGVRAGAPAARARAEQLELALLRTLQRCTGQRSHGASSTSALSGTK